MIVNSLVHQITLGREGRNWGYSTGLDKLDGVTGGLTKGTYTVLFSGSGSGKTSAALYCFVYRPLMEHLDDDNFKIMYYSLEMSSDLIFAKLLSMYIFEKHGVELSVTELLSRKKGYILSEENYEIVKECLPWLHKVEDILTVYDKTLNAEVLYTTMMKSLEGLGKFEETENRKIYTPNNDRLIYLVVIDHIALVRRSHGRTLKEEIDLTSTYLLTLRNMCGISPLVLMQANRDATSVDRRKLGPDGMNFQLSDTKDSGGPVQDGEIVLSIFNPFRERLNSYRGYDIKKLAGRFRSITVLKNRYGEADIEVGCNFFGKCGLWHELPKSDEIYDYEKYMTPEYLRYTTIENIDTVDKKEDKPKEKLNFVL